MLTEAAVSYFRGANALSRRVLDAEGGRLPDLTGLDYLDPVPPAQKVVRDESGTFRDEHSAPFSFRSRSQTDLAHEVELERSREIVDRDSRLDRDLLLSHSKVLSELKNALKSETKSPPPPPPNFERPAPAPPAPAEGGNFISKLMGGKKLKSGVAEERELLVSPNKRCQIVASSDNFFKTDFGSSQLKDKKETEQPRNVSNYKSSSGLEEARALLSGGSLQDSLGASTDSDFLSCEETPVDLASPSSSTFMLPKTGYDFLDNW